MQSDGCILVARIDNKLEILGKRLHYARSHLYHSSTLHLLGYIGAAIKGEGSCHDMNDPSTYHTPPTNCHTYQTIVLVLPVTELHA